MFFKKGLFQFTNFLERGINFRRNCLRTGRQFGVLGGTYPPKKYPSAPPRGGPDHMSVRRQRDLGIFKKHRGFSNLICNLSQVLRNDYGAGGQGLEAVAMYVMHKDMLLSRSSCAGEVRTSGASWVSNSTHPRKFGNHVTEH